jgi:hypothetical protein
MMKYCYNNDDDVMNVISELVVMTTYLWLFIYFNRGCRLLLRFIFEDVVVDNDDDVKRLVILIISALIINVDEQILHEEVLTGVVFDEQFSRTKIFKGVRVVTPRILFKLINCAM